MNRRIAQLTVLLAAGFAVLVIQLTNVGYFSADGPRRHQDNTRSAVAAIGAARGAITSAEGETIAVALAVQDSDTLQIRDYPHGRLYAHVAGYLSPAAGAGGLERSYDAELSGRAAEISLTRLADLFADSGRVGDLRLTIHHGVQLTARAALGDRDGAIVVVDVTTGAVVAMWSRPSFDPNVVVAATAESDAPPPPAARAYQSRYELSATAQSAASELLQWAATRSAATGLDLPAEPDLSGAPGDATLTPLHLALTAAAIGNGGALMTPFVVNRITARSASQPPDPQQAPAGGQVIQPHMSHRLVTTAEAADLLARMTTLAQQMSIQLRPTDTSEAAAAIASGIGASGIGASGNGAHATDFEPSGPSGSSDDDIAAAVAEWAVLLAPAQDPVIAVAVVIESDLELDAGDSRTGGTLASLIAATAAEAALALRTDPTSVGDGP